MMNIPVAPTTVLRNGTSIDAKMADALAALSQAAAYSLEIRISMDAIDPEQNDRIRGQGAFRDAVHAVQLLSAGGLLPILTVTELLPRERPPGEGMYEPFRNFFLALGIAKPRMKTISVFPVGRMAEAGGAVLIQEMLQGFDYSRLQCSEARVVATGGVYAGPIPVGLPEARLSHHSLEKSFKSCQLYHPAYLTCYQTSMTYKYF